MCIHLALVVSCSSVYSCNSPWLYHTCVHVCKHTITIHEMYLYTHCSCRYMCAKFFRKFSYSIFINLLPIQTLSSKNTISYSILPSPTSSWSYGLVWVLSKTIHWNIIFHLLLYGGNLNPRTSSMLACMGVCIPVYLFTNST